MLRPVTDAPKPAELPYRPRDPANPRAFGIALIGCGGITQWHLKVYRRAGYRVVALCDLDRARADARRAEFYPTADVYTDYRDVLARGDVHVVDVTTHPLERAPILSDAIAAGKHILSQKPFVLDLALGRRLVQAAARRGVQLAVNQNGRWAPHFAYMREAVAAGLIGPVTSVHMAAHWDHNWIVDFPFNDIRHIILYDYAIHWFDMLACLMQGRKALRVYASFARSPAQQAAPALLAQALVEYADAQASLVFDGDTRYGKEDRTFVVGPRGTITGGGLDDRKPHVRLSTAAGTLRPRLRGRWFPDGFHGTMGELLCALEEKRESTINARENLESLALCFAAVRSAETHQPVVPGEAMTLEP